MDRRVDDPCPRHRMLGLREAVAGYEDDNVRLKTGVAVEEQEEAMEMESD